MKATLRNHIFRLFAALGLCALTAGGCALPHKITLSFSENPQPMSEDRKGLVVTQKAGVTEAQKQSATPDRDLPGPPPPTHPRLSRSPAIALRSGTDPSFSLLHQATDNRWIKLVMPTARFTFLNESLFAGGRQKSAHGRSSAHPDSSPRLVAYEAFFDVVEEGRNPQQLDLGMVPEPERHTSDLVLRAGDFVFRAKVKNLKITFTWPVLEGEHPVNTHFRIEPRAILLWLNLKW